MKNIQEILNTLVIIGSFALLLAIANKLSKPGIQVQQTATATNSLPLMRGGWVVDQVTFWNSAYGAGYNAGFVDSEKKH